MTKLPTQKELQKLSDAYTVITSLASAISYGSHKEIQAEVAKHPDVTPDIIDNLKGLSRSSVMCALFNLKVPGLKLRFLGEGAFRSTYTSLTYPDVVIKIGDKFCNEREYSFYRSVSRKNKAKYARVFKLSKDNRVIVQRFVKGELYMELDRETVAKVKDQYDFFINHSDANWSNLIYSPDTGKLVMIDMGNE